MDKIIKVYESIEPYLGITINKTSFDYKKHGNSTYGEITYEGANKLIEKLGHLFNNETVFYDLGSGFGKFVYHIGMKVEPKKACGIEFSKERHDYAIGIKEALELTDEETSNISFINDSFLEQDLSDATVVYSDNTAFPVEITKQMINKLPKGTWMILRKVSELYSKEWKEVSDIMTSYRTCNVYIMQKNY